jgi:hypothetical protein
VNPRLLGLCIGEPSSHSVFWRRHSSSAGVCLLLGYLQYFTLKRIDFVFDRFEFCHSAINIDLLTFSIHSAEFLASSGRIAFKLQTICELLICNGEIFDELLSFRFSALLTSLRTDIACRNVPRNCCRSANRNVLNGKKSHARELSRKRQSGAGCLC